jgi:cell wall-associated NlpC family hydrolase
LSTAGVVGGGAAGGVLSIVLLVTTVVGAQQPATAAGMGQLQSGTVPAVFEPWVLKAGALCAQVPAPLVAAQLEAESGFNPTAVSPAGAQGPAQFMPSTWPSYGVDSDGNGAASPFDIGDAVMAQGRFDCVLAGQMQTALDAGQVTGDVIDLVLAAYNAGAGAVRSGGGIPRNGETPAYVSRIRSRMATYTQIGTGGTGRGIVAGAPFAQNVIAAASSWMGTRYSWGGGDVHGPTLGIRDGGVADQFGDYAHVGFDCSGLTTYAVTAASAASGGTLVLPHSAAAQSQMGTAVALTQIQPGDLLFFANPTVHHVGIYIGNGQMVNAPQSGTTVRIDNLSGWTGEAITARRLG